ncbi:MAG: hydrogenase [Nitrospinae bacterium]|nr:hydrogenase [Nitrospinota bacterium]
MTLETFDVLEPHILNIVFMSLLITNLYLLGSSRIGALIWTAGAQGALLAVLPLFPQVGEFSAHAILIAIGSGLIKGALIPWLLMFALKDAGVRRDVEPYVGFSLSLVIGVAFTAVSFWFASKIAVGGQTAASPFVSVAISMALCGMYLIASRKKALTQIIGYLTLENGVYVFGVSLASKLPFVVEMGIFLDIFVLVFVAGIVVFKINSTFDKIESAVARTGKEGV